VSHELRTSGFGVYVVDGSLKESNRRQAVDLGKWTTLTFDLPQGISPSEFRISLADLPCIVELAEVSLKDVASGRTLWAARETGDLRRLTFSTAATLLPFPDRCWLLGLENDLSVQMPLLPNPAALSRVEISLRLERSFDRLSDALRANVRALDRASQDRPSRAEIDATELRAELRNSQSERMLVAAQLSQVGADRQRLRIELDAAERTLESVRNELTSAKAEADTLRDSLASEKALRSAMECSRSWRLLAPVRALISKTKGQS